ncbi:MAG: hypothetical protein A2600_08685 [Candidatus Lambdaproteobacteria bacterium RIFOXYD1_FULL_56_27]|uniref:histidine kinase n=1 Tax=Candidatus Lambdaproteobacteria bacterium RIFOXYD2_FULL_56_26 TaxID=1817773 RepID=A0A1F6GZ14_9PROT|nr:MAG: hypothetical protein A2426_10105 [Candidatus Lambdaproteobacteria bacterium RIFOXYC1_FULL_56_13]OGH03388.1 MAG: hypothetical protein A2557_02580 [Candidatus Lambdaproteobacteria bacterium RIFOXYD2_FULL_56_26]OGH06607.1 MAG: hypothetical protein A2600_08685 [Candidatus Lambdaproteobacteria bacterium RIFOXYD1_FULL_56_27]
MKQIVLALFWAVLGLAPACACAQGEVVWESSSLSNGAGNLSYLEVKNKLSTTDFVPQRGNRFLYGFGQGNEWIHLKVTNHSAAPTTQVLELTSSLIDQVDLYSLANDSVQQSGEQVPVGRLQEFYLHPIFVIPFLAGETKEFLLLVKDEGSVAFNLNFHDSQAFSRAQSSSYLGEGFFNGFLGIMALASLVSFFILRERSFFEYFLLVATEIWLFCIYDGLFRNFLAPNLGPPALNRLYAGSVVLMMLGTLRFTHRFLDIKTNLPQGSKIIQGLSALLGLNLGLLYLAPFPLASQILSLLVIASLSCTLVISIFAWRKKVSASVYFIVAFLLMELCGILLAFQYLGFVKSPVGLDWFMHLGTVAEMLLLIFAVGDRIRLLARERNAAHQALLEQERQHALKIGEKNRELTQLDQLKDEFLANTTHELNTPLFGILGLTERLQESASSRLSPKETSQLGLILAMGRRLTHLIHDILDFAALKNKKLTLEIKPVDLSQLGQMVISLVEPLAHSKHLSLNFEFEKGLPFVMADENRLQQILFNLLGNAVKFTHQGEVTLMAREFGDSISIEVKDTGIGIAIKQWGRLFEPFVREHPEVIDEMGGSGLGLSITLQLIELQGGRLEMMSQPGQGTSFSFCLPAAKSLRSYSEPPPKKETQPHQVELVQQLGTKILVIDDEPGNVALLEDILGHQGYQVISAPGGVEGLEILEDLTPDLVLLDLMMPNINGYEVCKEMRRLFSPEVLPILILTAKSHAGGLEEAFAAGANDYITKPILGKELLARLELHLKIKENASLTERITLLDQTQRELSRTRESLISILDKTPGPVLLLDVQLLPRYANQSARIHFGLGPDQLPSLDKLFDGAEQLKEAAKKSTRLDPLPGVSSRKDGSLVSMAKLESGDWVLSLQTQEKKPVRSEADFREQIVKVMQLALDCWENSSGETKFDLAEKSGIWRIYQDEGRLRTRILDKYCSLKTLPQNPRYMDVIRTAHFVLSSCPQSVQLKGELQRTLEELQVMV